MRLPRLPYLMHLFVAGRLRAKDYDAVVLSRERFSERLIS